jgi:hypothetical protein
VRLQLEVELFNDNPASATVHDIQIDLTTGGRALPRITEKMSLAVPKKPREWRRQRASCKLHGLDVETSPTSSACCRSGRPSAALSSHRSTGPPLAHGSTPKR